MNMWAGARVQELVVSAYGNYCRARNDTKANPLIEKETYIHTYTNSKNLYSLYYVFFSSKRIQPWYFCVRELILKKTYET